MASAQIVIIGAGFAGAATAYYLTRSGVRDLVIIEQEDVAGVHSSGRNAGLVRQMVSDEGVASLVREGASFIHRLPAEWLTPTEFQQNGSLLLGARATWKKLMTDAERAQRSGVPVECLTAKEVKKKIFVLGGGDFDGAVWCPTDGVVDIHSLLEGYLRLAKVRGARFLTSTRVVDIMTDEGGIRAVVTESETIETDVVVNAAGAWARDVARLAGALSLPLSSSRRHLFTTGVLPWVKQDWPFVWDCTDDLYFRPEAGGLLLSPCDEMEHPPGIPLPDPTADVLLRGKLKRYPALENLPLKTRRAGLRTFADDRRFVIGWDPLIHGFFWVAGLGGHGVTASGSIGRLAAELIIGHEKEGIAHFSPSRFVHQ